MTVWLIPLPSRLPLVLLVESVKTRLSARSSGPMPQGLEGQALRWLATR